MEAGSFLIPRHQTRMTRCLVIASAATLIVAGGLAAAPIFPVDLFSQSRAPRRPDGPPVPIVAELFTSEGCSSCPPADTLLARLQREQPIDGAAILVMSEHVDYWNRLGWTDPFSSSAFSERQQRYATRLSPGKVYTPQLVVNGRQEVNGSDGAAVKRALEDARRDQKAIVELSVAKLPDTATSVAMRARGEWRAGATADESHDLVIALTEDDLVTTVTRGENAQRTLEHVGVVRRLEVVGELPRGEASVSIDTALDLDPGWKRDRLRAIAFLQSRRSHAIVGATMEKLTSH